MVPFRIWWPTLYLKGVGTIHLHLRRFRFMAGVVPTFLGEKIRPCQGVTVISPIIPFIISDLLKVLGGSFGSHDPWQTYHQKSQTKNYKLTVQGSTHTHLKWSNLTMRFNKHKHLLKVPNPVSFQENCWYYLWYIIWILQSTDSCFHFLFGELGNIITVAGIRGIWMKNLGMSSWPVSVPLQKRHLAHKSVRFGRVYTFG